MTKSTQKKKKSKACDSRGLISLLYMSVNSFQFHPLQRFDLSSLLLDSTRHRQIMWTQSIYSKKYQQPFNLWNHLKQNPESPGFSAVKFLSIHQLRRSQKHSPTKSQEHSFVSFSCISPLKASAQLNTIYSCLSFDKDVLEQCSVTDNNIILYALLIRL